MEELTIIRDKSQMEGTCYIEILPGKYEGNCWSSESIYFEEEAFGFLESVIETVVPEFDHYAFTEIEKDKWVVIIEKLKQLSLKLHSAESPKEVESELCFLYKGTQHEFESEFKLNKSKLSNMIDELCMWLIVHLENKQVISVLGI